MEELQLSLTPARVDQRNFGLMLSNWRVGQVLNALVVNSHPNGSVLLSVGGKQFVATTDIPVQPGARMNLEVKQLGQEVILRQVGAQLDPQALATARLAASAQTTASTGLASLLTQLAAGQGRLNQPQLAAVAQNLLGRALKGDRLTGDDVRRGVRQGGLFTEAALLAGQSHRAGASAKQPLSSLQQLAQALAEGRSADDPEFQALALLAERSTAALNGIVNQQLASIPQEQQPPRWVVSLPIELAGAFHDVRLVIQRDADSDDPEHVPAWRVTVHLDLPHLGAVDITVALRGNAVSVAFQCTEPTTSRRLDRSLERLSTRLEGQAFRVDRIASEQVADVGDGARDGTSLTGGGRFEVTA